ncbi:hypothetical protein [Amycolatopsis samaneae]|uniref:Uncharacterized protein n=1 Tax=Amycolatopsis samaneae TaxID=664691 RepID=A0ABW5GI87_9PSEU
MSLDEDIMIVQNSARMLPPWTPDNQWWLEFSRLTSSGNNEGFSQEYLQEKLKFIISEPNPKRHRTMWTERAKYILMFFDNPRLHRHLDAVQGTWESQVPGGIGRRWSETLCAAAWRIIVHEEPTDPYSNHFTVNDTSD